MQSGSVLALCLALPPASAATGGGLKDKAAPKAWKTTAFNALLPEPDAPGTVAVLAWEVIDNGPEVPGTGRCLVVRQYNPPLSDGSACAVGLFNAALIDDPVWRPALRWVAKQPESPPQAVKAVERHKTPPADDELAAFLERYEWVRRLQKHKVTVLPGRRKDGEEPPKIREVEVDPKVTDGGVCRAAWKAVFGREPAAELFPELAAEQPADKK